MDRSKDSPETSISDSWIRWLEENDYHEQVQNFMGVRPSRRHASVRNTRDSVLRESDLDASSSLRLEESGEVGTSSKSCIPSPWCTKKETSLSKLSSSLTLLACAAGVPSETKEEQDVNDFRIDDGWELKHSHLIEDDTHEEVRVRNKEVKKVTFLTDIVDQEIVPKPPRKQKLAQGRLERKLAIEIEQDQLERELEEVQRELTEMQFMMCIDTTEWLLGLREGSLKHIVRRDSFTDDDVRDWHIK